MGGDADLFKEGSGEIWDEAGGCGFSFSEGGERGNEGTEFWGERGGREGGGWKEGMIGHLFGGTGRTGFEGWA